jgi:ribonuclease HI
LLHKTGERTLVSNYRPITLINTDHKLLAKALVLRCAQAVDFICSPHQSAFAPNRWIGDNVLSHLAVLEHCESTGQPAVLALTDFRKAYDTLDRGWVSACLTQFGFGPRFRHWVQVMHTSIVCSAGLNGWRTPWFPVDNGVKQGDPLAPILFILAMQPLVCYISSLCSTGRITPLQLPCGNAPVTQQHADDLSALTSSLADMTTLFEEALVPFGAASNLHLQPSKCHGFALGTIPGVVGVHDPTGIPFVARGESVRHLGVRIAHDPAVIPIATFDAVVPRLRAAAASWHGAQLSLLGRAYVAKQVLAAALSYHLTFLSIPVVHCSEADRIIRGFIAKGCLPAAGAIVKLPVNKSIAALPLRLGGLGAPCVDAMTTGLHTKVFVHFLRPGRRLWKGLMAHVLGPITSLQQLRAVRNRNDVPTRVQEYVTRFLQVYPEYRDVPQPLVLTPPVHTMSLLVPQHALPASAVLEFDGGARGNPGVAGCGAALRHHDTGAVLATCWWSLGVTTNNVAEMCALLLGLCMATQLGLAMLQPKGDSALVVGALNKECLLSEPRLQAVASAIAAQLQRVQIVHALHVPRAQNALADRLSNLAMDAVALPNPAPLHLPTAWPALGTWHRSPNDDFVVDAASLQAYREGTDGSLVPVESQHLDWQRWPAVGVFHWYGARPRALADCGSCLYALPHAFAADFQPLRWFVGDTMLLDSTARLCTARRLHVTAAGLEAVHFHPQLGLLPSALPVADGRPPPLYHEEARWSERASVADPPPSSSRRTQRRADFSTVDFTASWMQPSGPHVSVRDRVQLRQQIAPCPAPPDAFAPPPALQPLPERAAAQQRRILVFTFMTDRSIPRDYLVTPWKLLHLVAFCNARAYFHHFPGAQPFCTNPTCTAQRVPDTLSHRFYHCPVVAPVWMWISAVLALALADATFATSRDAVLLNTFAYGTALAPQKRPLWQLFRCSAIHHINERTRRRDANSLTFAPVDLVADVVASVRAVITTDAFLVKNGGAAAAADTGPVHMPVMSAAAFSDKWGAHGVLYRRLPRGFAAALELNHPFQPP